MAAAKASPEQAWIRELACRLLFGKVLVVIANKHARQPWAMWPAMRITTHTRGSNIRIFVTASETGDGDACDRADPARSLERFKRH